MNTKNIIITIFVLGFIAIAAHSSLAMGRLYKSEPAQGQGQKVIYTCPMHSQIHQDHPGQCPLCGMDLVKKDSQAHKSPTCSCCGMKKAS